jgi:hypothetical protein
MIVRIKEWCSLKDLYINLNVLSENGNRCKTLVESSVLGDRLLKSCEQHKVLVGS